VQAFPPKGGNWSRLGGSCSVERRAHASKTGRLTTARNCARRRKPAQRVVTPPKAARSP
jgi:hypothetical protein